MRATWPVMSEGEELVAPAYLSPRMSRALRTAVDVGVIHCALLFICIRERCVSKHHCCHALPASSASRYQTTVTAAAATKNVLRQAQTNVENVLGPFALKFTTLLRDASALSRSHVHGGNLEDVRNTFGARLRGISWCRLKSAGGPVPRNAR